MGEARQSSETQGGDRVAALVSNAGALRAVASAVEGTIGPKGLDTMLVDRFGDVVVTNDGCTILERMDASHPAARMLINAARAQQEEVGDGTTTTTIMASALVQAGLDMVAGGVPVPRLVEGVRIGAEIALEVMEGRSRKVSGLGDPLLPQVAYIAGRGRQDIARLAVDAARLAGIDSLIDPAFRLRDAIVAEEGAATEVFMGVIIGRGRQSRYTPRTASPARILALDDALEPEKLDEEALATERGLERHLALREEFEDSLKRLIDMGVNVVLVDRGVADIAEDILADAGVIVAARVAWRELERAGEHTGARPVKRTWLARPREDLEKVMGAADQVYEDEKLSHIRVLGGRGKPMATIVVGASTDDVAGERDRIAQDAVSAVQAAVRRGVVAGGGAAEIACARRLLEARQKVRGMAAYGVDCVVSALKRPLAQIVQNAGYNPLEKVEQVLAAQAQGACDSLGVDCETGEIADMFELGIVDPLPIKLHAVRAACEVGEAVLRIDRIVKKREDSRVDDAKEVGT